MRTAIRLLALTAVLPLLACTQPTAVSGTLKRESGIQGDVRGSRVELHELFDLSDAPAYSVESEQGEDARFSDFRFEEVAPGEYYVLAWKDIDGDGAVSDGDLAGVRGSRYKPESGGTPVEVTEGFQANAGAIELFEYYEPLDSVYGLRSFPAGDTTGFAFSFKHDLELRSLSIAFPGLGTFTDPEAPGEKFAGEWYFSGNWSLAGGEEMPSGTHVLSFRGTLEGEAFVVYEEVEVQ